MTEPRIALAVVHPGVVSYDWHQSVLRTLGAFPGQVSLISVQSGPLIAKARNNVLELFLKSDAGHLLFTDSDISWAAEAVTSLLEVGEPIVSAAYYGKGMYQDAFPVFCTREGRKLIRPVDFPDSTSAIPVFGVGMGFCLIRRDVIERLAPIKTLWPYAEVMYGSEALGEDVTFCMRAAKKGYGSFLLPSVRVGHLKQVVI